MALPTLSVPVADLALAWGPDPTGQGDMMVDFVLAPDADLALVIGVARMVQDVTRWIYVSVGGDPFNPSYGSPFWSFVGQPLALSLDFYEAMLAQGETVFQATQAQEYKQGWRTADDCVDHFENVSIQLGPGGLSLVFNLNVISLSGASGPVAAQIG